MNAAVPNTLHVLLAAHTVLTSQAVVAEAAGLARVLDAELAARMIEEPALLRSLSLPVSIEVGSVSGAVRRSDADATRRLLARTADELRLLVERSAEATGVPWSFAVTSGSLIAEALRDATVAPVLLAPGASARQELPGRRGEGTRQGTVAVLGSSGTSGTPARAAWTAAVRLAGGRADTVVPLPPAGIGAGPAPRLLVVSLASLASPEQLARVLRAARCPVVLVA